MNRPDHPSSVDQRQEYRLRANETVYLELESAPTADQGQILLSRSTDLSANGLQLELDRPLPVGHIYSLCIELKNPPARFVLAGEIKWCRREADHYRLGVVLFESDDTGIEQWKSEMARRLGHSPQ